MEKVEYLDDNLKSIDLELTAEDLREIDNELSKINVQGARLDEGLLSMSEDQESVGTANEKRNYSGRGRQHRKTCHRHSNKEG
jgi:hypothetical protein